jgi:hypothetical protein
MTLAASRNAAFPFMFGLAHSSQRTAERDRGDAEC